MIKARVSLQEMSVMSSEVMETSVCLSKVFERVSQLL